MIKVLVIGCGNIGALYDLNDPDKIWTHVKAWSQTKDVDLFITDADQNKAKKIAEAYQACFVPAENLDYKSYDLISLTTPTSAHYEYLQKIFLQSSSTVICEKPVVNSLEHVDELKNLYNASSSKVLVNYMRRFQPPYEKLKNNLKENHFLSLRNLIVKYSRGFLNNASHAVDLLEYLYDLPFDFDKFHILKEGYDAFEDDPTIIGHCLYGNVPVSFVGITDIEYPVFEIEMFYGNSKIVLCHSGDEIRYYARSDAGSLTEVREKRQENILQTYMMPVIKKALALHSQPKENDNFLSSLSMNKKMLNIIETIKKTNATVSH